MAAMKCFEVERKINLLALAAFVISLAGIAGHIQAFIKGADLCLFPPERVMLVTLPNPTCTKFLHVAACMAYVNRGAKGYHEIVRREGVSFSLGEQQYHQYWQYFVEVHSLDGNRVLKSKSSAMPIRVDPIQPTGHITLFAPGSDVAGKTVNTRNFLPVQEFSMALAEEKQITFEFWAETLSGKRHSVRCQVIARDLREEWAVSEGFAAPICQELSTG
jgi:hypothetical protein